MSIAYPPGGVAPRERLEVAHQAKAGGALETGAHLTHTCGAAKFLIAKRFRKVTQGATRSPLLWISQIHLRFPRVTRVLRVARSCSKPADLPLDPGAPSKPQLGGLATGTTLLHPPAAASAGGHGVAHPGRADFHNSHIAGLYSNRIHKCGVVFGKKVASGLQFPSPPVLEMSRKSVIVFHVGAA